MTPEAATRDACLSIEGPLSIAEVAIVLPPLLARLATHPVLALDMSGVTHVDAAGLQMLMFAAREARAAGGAVRLQSPSRAVIAALGIARLGVDLLPMTTGGEFA